MKYHIDTIPVWDSYRLDAECPLCVLYMDSEKKYIDSFLGASVMEPDTRVDVNRKGFCQHHFSQLYYAQNRLGLALMTHTHMKEILHSLDQKMEELLKSLCEGKEGMSFFFKSMKKASGTPDETISLLEKYLEEQQRSCIICERLVHTMDRYVYTILYLWEKEMEFRKVFLQSKGFCLPHFRDMVRMAHAELNAKKQAIFLKDLITVQRENMHRLEKELEWFTLKFDYRNQDKPWGNSRDALPRSVNKLKGETINE